MASSSLFVFLIGSHEQNGVKLLTPVSDSIFIALSGDTFLFSLHGSFKNHHHKALWLAVGIVSTNQVMVKWATIQSKMNGTIWKSIENLIRNWCQKFHTILLRVISVKNKQWTALPIATSTLMTEVSRYIQWALYSYLVTSSEHMKFKYISRLYSPSLGTWKSRRHFWGTTRKATGTQTGIPGSDLPGEPEPTAAKASHRPGYWK